MLRVYTQPPATRKISVRLSGKYYVIELPSAPCFRTHVPFRVFNFNLHCHGKAGQIGSNYIKFIILLFIKARPLSSSCYLRESCEHHSTGYYNSPPGASSQARPSHAQRRNIQLKRGEESRVQHRPGVSMWFIFALLFPCPS